VARTLVKLTFVIVALAAATCFGTWSSRAYGDAPAARGFAGIERVAVSGRATSTGDTTTY
jgi:hypothetical protein